MVAAGSQERRMAERQANGRPGTDKGRGAGTLEAWVREPQGPGQGAVLVPYPVGWGRLLPFRVPTSRGVLFLFPFSSPLLFFAALLSPHCPPPLSAPPILGPSNSDLLSLVGPLLLLCK